MFNIIIAWLILDIAAVLMVLHDYHQWYGNTEALNEVNPPNPSADRLPAA